VGCRFWLLSVLTSAALTLCPLHAGAQTTPPFVIESDHGDNRLQLGALVQFDGRFFAGDVDGLDNADTFLIRRLRPVVQGRVAKYFDFFVQLDFAGAAINIRDAYIDTRFSDAFHMRVGKGKAPFGLERLQSVANLLFSERALPTTVAPDRDMQIEALGDLHGGLVSYAAAIGNGVVDGGADDVDVNQGKDLTGRLVVRPWVHRAMNPLSSLGLALAGSYGTQPSLLPTFRTSGQQTYFTYASGAVGEGKRSRASPQAFYYHGPFGGYAEYVRSAGRVRHDLVAADLDHVAWQVAASWMLTGEAATDQGVRPRTNFDPGHHSWGAFQIGARYHQLTVDRAAVTLGLASPSSSRIAHAWTGGATWYLNPFVKWLFNVERTVFDASSSEPRPPENLIVARAQLAF